MNMVLVRVKRYSLFENRHYTQVILSNKNLDNVYLTTTPKPACVYIVNGDIPRYLAWIFEGDVSFPAKRTTVIETPEEIEIYYHAEVKQKP